MKKKRVSFGRFFERNVNRLFIFLALLNTAVIFLFEIQRRPRIERVEIFTTTNHVVVVTNYLSSSFAPSLPTSPSIVSSNLVQEILAPERSVYVPYQFMYAMGRHYILFHGDYLTVGSPTSYGRIVSLFPDRVLLDTNIWLVNSNLHIDSIRSPSVSGVAAVAPDFKRPSTAPVLDRIKRNDRISD